MKKWFLQFAAFGFCSMAIASDCRTPQQQVLIPSAAIQTITVPAYSANYTGSTDELLRQILERLDRILSRLEIVEIMNGQSVTGLSIMQSRCMACHADINKAKGGEFVMFVKGQISPFSLTEKRRIEARIAKGQMPPDKPLEKYERETIIKYLKGEGP